MKLGCFILEIGCAPGPIRPDTYAKEIFNDLGIEYCEPVNKFFGDWSWEVMLQEDKFNIVREKHAPYLKELYDKGAIRYSNWQLFTEDEMLQKKEDEESEWNAIMEMLKEGKTVEVDSKIDGVRMKLTLDENGRVKTEMYEVK